MNAISAGSYHRPLFSGADSYYEAGQGSFGEARNYFVFSVPALVTRPASAELRVFTGVVLPQSGSVQYELHSVEAVPVIVMQHSAEYDMIFDDLGEGTLLGSVAISGAAGSIGENDPGSFIRVPLTGAAIDQVMAAQNTWVAFGGSVPNVAPQTLVFGENTFNYYQGPQLVLYLSNSGPPQVTILDPTRYGEKVAGERVTLAASVCGAPPLLRQWFKNGAPIPDATNDIFELVSMSESDAGTYQLAARNHLLINSSWLIDVPFAPLRIASGPQQLSLLQGQSTTISFSVFSVLPVSYQWRKNGTNLPGQVQGTLPIINATVSDSGNYDVVASNSSGSRTSSVVTLSVIVQPPVFPYAPPQFRSLVVGRTLEMFPSPANGSAPISYQWYRDGEPVPGAATNYLRIGAIGFSDAGAYYLVAANSAGSATSEVYQVTIEALLIYNVGNSEVLLQNPFTFNAYVDSAAPYSVQWYFNDEPLAGATNTQLHFASPEPTNTGPYFVVASNAYGMATSVVANLTVIVSPPSADVRADGYRFWVGEDMAFQSYVWGGPPPTVQWLFNDEPIPGATQRRLYLAAATTNHSGLYSIMASNVYGSVTSAPVSISVVAEGPFFISLPTRTNALAGDIVTLRAKAVAGPPPSYQWQKDGVDLPGQTNTTLQLDAVRPADAGVYEIVARNQLGEARHAHRFVVSPATGLDRWRWHHPSAQGSRLYEVASVDGRYVAVGKSGNLIVSSNGLDWSAGLVEADLDLRVVAAGNGVFLAGGYTYDPLILTNVDRFYKSEYQRYNLSDFPWTLLVSSNGADWQLSDSSGAESFWSIAFGKGVFVANGFYGHAFCYTSRDGRLWTATRTTAEYPLAHILFGNDRFVGYGNDGSLYYSLDGLAWTATGVTGLGLLGFGNGTFLGGDSLNHYASEDGVSWRHLGIVSGTPAYNDITGGAGAFVGASSLPPGQVSYSTDGINWRPVDTGTKQEIEAVIYANGQFVGVGEAGTITRSVDGLSWTPDEVANKIDYYGITSGNGLNVAVGDSGTILTSSNAVDWTLHSSSTTRNLHAVAYANGLFVAGGRGGTLITSPDGVNWISRSSGTTNYIERIAYANGLWVAAAEGGAIPTSTNGIDWIAAQTTFTDHEGVAYGNGTWVIVGGYFGRRAIGTIFTSVDGKAWFSQPVNPGKRWRDVTFGAGRFVAVGNDGAMAYSTNGLNWSYPQYITYQNLRSVHYANGRFVAVGNDGTLLSSADPVADFFWTKHRAHTSLNLHDIAAVADGTFLAVGNNGMLLQSGDTRPRFLRLGRGGGTLEFDRGIAANLRLERSFDLRTWQIEATNVVSPHGITAGGSSAFWRLAGD